MAALSGIRVLDLTRLLPGPFGTMILADHGADVIKVEEPRTGDPMRQFRNALDGVDQIFELVNRGKRSVTVDLRSDLGQAFFHKLLERADVLIEGFRPGVMQRLRLDFPTLAKRYPRLIYCSISGFGQSGPQRLLPGHDVNYLGYAGLLPARTDDGAPPPLPPTLPTDLQAGLCAALGILLGLQERVTTGQGRFVDINMTRSLAPFLLPGLSAWSNAAGPHHLPTPWFCGGLACYGVYRTLDGQWITIAALELKFWREFCSVAGRPDLVPDHLVPQRQAALRDEVAKIIAGRSAEQWLEIARTRDVCIGPARQPAEALADSSLCDAGWPGPFDCAPQSVVAPPLGADTRQVLVEELGCDPAEVQRGIDEGVL
ncbi:MAG: CaiB/BaiF CoA transferase family protein [Planctomycetaceae bacterium]